MNENRLYECTQVFLVPLWDSDNDCFYEDESKRIDKGSVWEITTGSICGGEIHLENVDDLSWIEINNDTLRSCFKDITDDNNEMTTNEYLRSGY